MRIRALVAMLLCAVALGQAAVVAENGLTVIGDRGADAIRGGPAPRRHFQLPFHLAAPARVWVEAQGLQGLRSGSDAAPEVFVDDSYLGPLRAEHGLGWRSPQALSLDAGEHVLELRCADVMDADDVSIQRLQVLSDAAATQRPKVKVGEAPRRTDCGALVGRRDWPERLHGRAIILSVLSGRSSSAGTLIHLRQGERWQLRARVPLGADGKPLALRADLAYDRPGAARLTFSVEQGVAVPVDSLGYTPAAWQPLSFRYCGGHLAVDFARSPSLVRANDAPALGIEIAAKDLELSLKPARP